MQDEVLQTIQTFKNKNYMPPHLSKQDQAYYKTLTDKVFQDKNKVVWIRLSDFNYPRMALYLPSRYRKSARLTSGRKWDKTLNVIKTIVFDGNNGRILQTNEHRWRRFQLQNVQTSGFTPTFLAQWSQWTVTKNLSSASRTHSLSTLWSLRLSTRMLKWWLTPFTEIGSQNLEFLHKYTTTTKTYLPALAISYNTSYSFYDSNNSILEKKHHYLPFQMGISSKFTTAKLQRQKDSICYRSTSIRHRTRTKIQKHFWQKYYGPQI